MTARDLGFSNNYLRADVKIVLIGVGNYRKFHNYALSKTIEGVLNILNSGEYIFASEKNRYLLTYVCSLNKLRAFPFISLLVRLASLHQIGN